MRKTQKRILGLFGLLVVAAMTITAAIMPDMRASAVSSITDTVQIRVVGSVPDAKFTKPEENIITTANKQTYGFSYENVTDVRLAITYVGEDGVLNLPNYKVYHNPDHNPGTVTDHIDLTSGGFSYGKYKFSLFATGSEGTELPYDSVSIDFLPVIASSEQNDEDDMIDVKIDSVADEVESVDIYVDGKLVKTVPRDELDKIIKIPMDGKTSGNYVISIVAKGPENKKLYLPYDMNVDYEKTKVPNTGVFFQNLNISKEDYLVTGLIVFFVIGIVAFGIIARDNKKRH